MYTMNVFPWPSVEKRVVFFLEMTPLGPREDDVRHPCALMSTSPLSLERVSDERCQRPSPASKKTGTLHT